MGDAFTSYVLLPDLTIYEPRQSFQTFLSSRASFRSMLEGGESDTRCTAGARSCAGRTAGPPCVLVPVERERERVWEV